MATSSRGESFGPASKAALFGFEVGAKRRRVIMVSIVRRREIVVGSKEVRGGRSGIFLV